MPKPYTYYIENGICPNCHSRPKSSVGVLCELCATKRKAYQEARKTSALCRNCGKPTTPGKTRCQVCLDREKDGTKRRRQQRLENKLCLICGKNPVTTRQICNACAEQESMRHKQIRLERVANNLCTTCGQAIDDSTYRICSTCRAKELAEITDRYHKRRQENLCIYCGKPIESDSPSKINCVVCYRKNRKHRITTNSRQRYGGNLETVMERDGQCVVCGKLTKLVCHHMDSDVSNNDLTNLVILCRKCHVLVTMWIDCTNRQSMLDFLLKNYPIQEPSELTK